MEAFSLLKYWRTSTADSLTTTTKTKTKTILTAVTHRHTGTDTDPDDADGPFFDLQLALPEEEEDEEGTDDGEINDSDAEIECTEPEISLSRSDSDEKSEISPAKSSSKLRVLMLKLKKPNPRNAAENSDTEYGSVKSNKTSSFTLKFRIEEVFTRGANKSVTAEDNSDESVTADEKLFSIERYLKKVKPLYVRVSKRYVEKIRFSGVLDSPSETEKSTAVEVSKAVEASPVTVKSPKQGNFPAGLRIVCKRLGKSRSASSGAVPAKRSDDSFLEQQDGIQSAILHCKRSFNSPSSSSSTDEKDSDSSMF